MTKTLGEELFEQVLNTKETEGDIVVLKRNNQGAPIKIMNTATGQMKLEKDLAHQAQLPFKIDENMN